MTNQDYASLTKILKRLGNITKHPFALCFERKHIGFSPPTQVTISESFYRSAKCKMCGKCDRKIQNVSLVYTASEVDWIRSKLPQLLLEEKGVANKLLSGLKKVQFTLLKNLITHSPDLEPYFGSGREAEIYVYRNTSGPCDFAIEGLFDSILCGIHKVKPIHCALPMLQIDRTKDSARLIKRPRGRNWRFGCPVEFKEFDYEEFLKWDLHCLSRLWMIERDLGLDTWLTEILNYLIGNLSEISAGHLEKHILVKDGKVHLR